LALPPHQTLALPPHQNWLEKANFLWENEKMPQKFYKEKAKPRSELSFTTGEEKL
jgi:hypothetical protein